MRTDKDRTDSYEIAAWIIAAASLFFVLKFHLLPALIAGLLVYELINILEVRMHITKLTAAKAKFAAVMLLAVVIVLLLGLGIWELKTFLRSGSEGLPVLMHKMAEILEGTRNTLPSWLAERMPEDIESLKDVAIQWLREHAGELQLIGKEVGRVAAHILIGMALGVMVSLRHILPGPDTRPLALALAGRSARLADAFRSVVFAQVKISAINAVLAWVYLGLVLPVAGVHLPLVKSMVAITFIAGLLPIIGNLISNVIIVVVSLSNSPVAALASFAFLVVVHKLEYFLNARIIGSQVHCSAWEMLLALLVMEAAFGMPGLIAAPIYYAYIKRELEDKHLV